MQDLKSRSDAIRWYHTIDLGGGVVTSGVDDTPYRLRRVKLPPSLRGLSVLDIGAWDGFFSFECERRGAARVVAADYYSWHGGGWGTKAGFTLAREALGSRVEDVDIDVMDLSLDRVGQFDVVLFLGVFYHLRHPFTALERIAPLVRRQFIVETVLDMVGISRPAMAFYPSRELNNDPTNWWAPNVPAMRGMLETVGFDRVETVTGTHGPVYRAARAAYHQVRGKNPFGPAFRQDRAVFHAFKNNPSSLIQNPAS
jgi:tRNA (mo5U34)-methyltransferase